MKRVVLALLLLQLANGGCDRWQSREVSDPPKRAPVKDDANRSVAEGGEYTQLFVPLTGVPPSEGCQLKDYSYASEVKCFALSEGDLVKNLLIKDANPSDRIRLFPTTNVAEELLLSKERATPIKSNQSGTGYRWFGNVYLGAQPEKKIGTALLSLRNGRIIARITTENDVYEIKPLGNGVHAVIKADTSKSLPIHPDKYLDREKGGSYSAPVSTGKSDSWDWNWPELIKVANAAPACPAQPPINRSLVPTVRVALAFEKSAVKPFDEIVELAAAFIDFTQTAMENSRVSLNVALPVAEEARLIENFVISDESLNELTEGNHRSGGTIGSIHQWREKVRADLVVIITKNVGYCGLSAQVKPDKRNFGFALVHPDCTNVQLQVSHEIGHLLGGDHELNNARSDRSDSDARAHILEGLNRKTIMYVNSSFPEPYFSNPDVCWDLDHPMGVAEVANNARAMSARASVVSKFCR